LTLADGMKRIAGAMASAERSAETGLPPDTLTR
jgi:hypothetical protein